MLKIKITFRTIPGLQMPEFIRWPREKPKDRFAVNSIGISVEMSIKTAIITSAILLKDTDLSSFFDPDICKALLD